MVKVLHILKCQTKSSRDVVNKHICDHIFPLNMGDLDFEYII